MKIITVMCGVIAGCCLLKFYFEGWHTPGFAVVWPFLYALVAFTRDE
jgi:hypothetical protein